MSRFILPLVFLAACLPWENPTPEPEPEPEVITNTVTNTVTNTITVEVPAEELPDPNCAFEELVGQDTEIFSARPLVRFDSDTIFVPDGVLMEYEVMITSELQCGPIEITSVYVTVEDNSSQAEWFDDLGVYSGFSAGIDTKSLFLGQDTPEVSYSFGLNDVLAQGQLTYQLDTFEPVLIDSNETVALGFAFQAPQAVPEDLLPRLLIMKIYVSWVDVNTGLEKVDYSVWDTLLLTIYDY